MTRFSLSKPFRILAGAIKRIFRKHGPEPDDPYALVTAPTQPRPPTRSASVAAEPER
jgi:hypothetical protein